MANKTGIAVIIKRLSYNSGWSGIIERVYKNVRRPKRSMSPPILFLAGLSGAGKSTLMKWIAQDFHFWPLEIDLPGQSGIDVHGLRHEWNCFSRRLDAAPLASALRDQIAPAACSGAVLSFPSDAIFTRDKIEIARHVGIYTAILCGVAQHCIDSFLKREQETGRGFDETRWHLKNDRASSVYGGQDYANFRFDPFDANGSYRPRADIVNAIAEWLDAERIVGPERGERVS